MVEMTQEFMYYYVCKTKLSQNYKPSEGTKEMLSVVSIEINVLKKRQTDWYKMTHQASCTEIKNY